MKQLLAVLLQSCVRGSCTSLPSLKPTHRLLQQLSAQLLPCVLGVNMSKEYTESYILKESFCLVSTSSLEREESLPKILLFML